MQIECLVQLSRLLSIHDSYIRLFLAVILLILRLSQKVVFIDVIHVRNVKCNPLSGIIEKVVDVHRVRILKVSNLIFHFFHNFFVKSLHLEDWWSTSWFGPDIAVPETVEDSLGADVVSPRCD